ncbi:MAG: HDOD domain-containing protein [Gammaproteobacteria bacterium]
MARPEHAHNPLAPATALVQGMVDLVPLPQAYVRIRQAVDDPATDLRMLAEIVSSDPALAGRVLRLVNSAYLGLMAPIDSIAHAVRVLGMRQIHDMALATSAVGSLSRLRSDVFDIREFWRLSVYAAACARELARRVGLPAPERLFLCGLLHNIGSLVLAHEMPEACLDAQAAARDLGRPYFELQRERFGFDYAEVSAELLRHWNLSAGLVMPILLHTHAIENLADEDQADTAVVSIAATTARVVTWESPASSEPIPDYDATALALTAVDAETIDELMNHVDDDVTEALAVLLPEREPR